MSNPMVDSDDEDVSVSSHTRMDDDGDDESTSSPPPKKKAGTKRKTVSLGSPKSTKKQKAEPKPKKTEEEKEKDRERRKKTKVLNAVAKSDLTVGNTIMLSQNRKYIVRTAPVSKHMAFNAIDLAEDATKTQQLEFWDTLLDLTRKKAIEYDGLHQLFVLEKVDKNGPTGTLVSAFWVNGCMLVAGKSFVTDKWQHASRLLVERVSVVERLVKEMRSLKLSLSKGSDKEEKAERLQYLIKQLNKFLQDANPPTKLNDKGTLSTVTWPPELLSSLQTKYQKFRDGLTTRVAAAGASSSATDAASDDEGTGTRAKKEIKRLDDVLSSAKTLPPGKGQTSASLMKHAFDNLRNKWLQDYTIELMKKKELVVEDRFMPPDVDGLYYAVVAGFLKTDEINVTEDNLAILPSKLPDFKTFLAALNIKEDDFFTLEALMHPREVQHAIRHHYYTEHPLPTRAGGRKTEKKVNPESATVVDLENELAGELEQAPSTPKPKKPKSNVKSPKPNAAAASAAAEDDEKEASDAHYQYLRRQVAGENSAQEAEEEALAAQQEDEAVNDWKSYLSSADAGVAGDDDGENQV